MDRKVRWSMLAAGGVVLLALALVGDGGLWGQRADAQMVAAAGGESYVFLLTLGEDAVGEYLECSGLGSFHEVEDRTVITVTGSVVVRGAPGVLQWPQIVLKRSSPGDIKVAQWRKTMEDLGQAAALREGRITLYQAGSTQPLAQWTFTRGWPAALVSNNGQEELVIVHEGLTRVGTTGGGGTTTTRR